VPAAAVAGSNVPADALVMPVPDHVPPAGDPERLVAGSPEQNGPAAVTEGVGTAFTVMLVVLELPQLPGNV
jgi:hypothetical protein